MDFNVEKLKKPEGQARVRWETALVDRHLIPHPIFCPVHDAFSPADFRRICSISQLDYILKSKNSQINASYSFTTSFNAGIVAHNFYDMVGFAYLSKAEASSVFSLHSEEVADIFLEIFSEIFDLENYQYIEEWKEILFDEIHGCMEQNLLLFDREVGRLSEIRVTVNAAMQDVCTMIKRANSIASLGQEIRVCPSPNFWGPPSS